MENNLHSLLASKFLQTVVDGLEIDNSYVVLGNPESVGIICQDLLNLGFQKNLGFFLAHELLSPSTGSHAYAGLSPSDALSMLEGGAHLVLTAGEFVPLIEFCGIEKIRSWRERIHLVKITNWFQEKSGKDPYRHHITEWAYEQLQKGHIEKSVELLELFLELYGPRELDVNERLKFLSNMDEANLQNGIIASVFNCGANPKLGWLYYKDAVSHAILRGCGSLPHPLWNGEEWPGRRIVFRREPSPGDEIVYSHVFKDIIEDGCHVIIEADPRLVSLFQRSFPQAEVVPRELPDAHPRLLESNIDFQANFSDPFINYRDSLEKFPDHRGFLVPDAQMLAYWHSKFENIFADGLRIGISWGSGSSGAIEDLMKTELHQWTPILVQERVNFINLQYGDVSDEVNWAQRELGVHIHEISEFDMFNDLEGLAAIIASLDLVISVNNLNSHLAGALGAPLWEIVPIFWHLRFGQNYSPFSPRARVFDIPEGQLTEISESLNTIINTVGNNSDYRQQFRKLAERSNL